VHRTCEGDYAAYSHFAQAIEGTEKAIGLAAAFGRFARSEVENPNLEMGIILLREPC
jgi:hypothetical protein